MSAPIPNPWMSYSEADNCPPAPGSAVAQPDTPCAAAVDIDEPSMTMEAPDEAPAVIENPEDRRDFDWDPNGIDNIGEIFFHASKLIADDYRDWALTQEDDDLYEQLKREDRANTRDIPIPDQRALEEELMPLFLRRTA